MTIDKHTTLEKDFGGANYSSGHDKTLKQVLCGTFMSSTYENDLYNLKYNCSRLNWIY